MAMTKAEIRKFNELERELAATKAELEQLKTNNKTNTFYGHLYAKTYIPDDENVHFIIDERDMNYITIRRTNSGIYVSTGQNMRIIPRSSNSIEIKNENF